ncbi:MAG: glycosyltransferase family 1 protein [Planctomycetota bacterium]
MRIVVNTLSVSRGRTGGGETYLVNLTKWLARVSPGDEFVLIESGRNRACFEGLPENVEHRFIPRPFSSRGMRVLFERLFLERTTRRLAPDVLFMPGNAGLPHPPCAEVVAVQSLLPMLAPEEVGFARRVYFRRALPGDLRRATLVLAVSQDIGQVLQRRMGVPAEKIRVVHEGVSVTFAPVRDEEVLRRELATAGVHRPYLLLVGGLKRYKNADKAILALARLNTMIDVPRQLVVIGSDRGGVRPELERLAAEAGVGNAVRFAGTVEHARLAAFYSGADALVFPSSIESFGLPVLEAMACGLAVVGSNCASVPEIIGDAGLTVDPSDIGALAEALRRVLKDEPLRRELLRKGFERVRHFSWERSARGVLAVLREAAEMGRTP